LIKRNDMIQTAVEWFSKLLIDELTDNGIEYLDLVYEIIEQASELFEQQIKDAYVDGFKECEKIHEEVFFIKDLSEEYYNETYKNKEK